MQKLKSWFLSVFYGSGGAFMNFPAAVAFGLFAVIVQFIAFPIGTDEDLYKALMLACITGITSNIMFSLIFKRSRLEGLWTLAFTGLGIAVPSAVFLLLFTADASAMEMLIARITAANLFILLVILLLMTRRNGKFQMSRVIFSLVAKLAAGVVYGALFFCGLSVITIIVKVLFVRDMSSVVFQYLFILSLYVVYIVFLGGVNSLSDPREPSAAEKRYYGLLEKLVCYIGIPVVVIFFLTEAVWLFNGIWWGNWPSALDIFRREAVFLGTACFVYLLTCNIDNLPCRLYRGFLPVVGIPMLGIGVWRLGSMVVSYGLTGARYFALAGYIFLAVCLLTVLISPRGNGLVIVATAMVLTVISVFPVFNYRTVSVFSQVVRAENIMKRNGMLENGAITAPAEISETDRIELSRAVQYIADSGETEMAAWLPPGFSFESDYKTVFGVAGEFSADTSADANSKVLVGALSNKVYSASGYDYVLVNSTTYNFFNFSMDNIIGENGTYSVRFVSDPQQRTLRCVIQRDGEQIADRDLSFYLSRIVGYLEQNAEEEGAAVSVPDTYMTVVISGDGVRLKVVLKHVTASAADREYGYLTTALTDTILFSESDE